MCKITKVSPKKFPNNQNNNLKALPYFGRGVFVGFLRILEFIYRYEKKKVIPEQNFSGITRSYYSLLLLLPFLTIENQQFFSCLINVKKF